VVDEEKEELLLLLVLLPEPEEEELLPPLPPYGGDGAFGLVSLSWLSSKFSALLLKGR